VRYLVILPNKLIPLRESVIGKITSILPKIEEKSYNVLDLYLKNQKKFEDINQYILTLDILYILEKIEFDADTGRVFYVKKDNM